MAPIQNYYLKMTFRKQIPENCEIPSNNVFIQILSTPIYRTNHDPYPFID